MIRPRSITIEGYCSFRDEVTYYFPQGSGLYLVIGRNKAEPRLGANGVGKSNFFGAMCWCLYGKSARGLRAGNVSHWSGEYLTSVQLTLEVTNNGQRDNRTGSRFHNEADRRSAESFPRNGAGSDASVREGDRQNTTIRRTHNPNSIRLDGEETDQQSIDQLVGVNYEGFLATVLLGQFNRFFFDLSPTEKLDVFSNALDLSQWTQAADKAKQRSKEFAQNIQQVEADQNATKAVIGVIQTNAKNLTLAARTYEKDRQQSKQVLTAYIQQRQPELEQTQKQLRQHQKQLTRLLDRQDDLNRKADKQEKHRHERNSLEQKRKDLNGQLKELAEANGTCPTCGQSADKKHLQAKRRELSVQLAITLETIRQLPPDELSQGLTAIQQTQKEVTEARKREERLARQQSELRQQLNRKKDQLNELDKQADPYASQLTQLKQDEQTNQQKLISLNGQYADLTKRLNTTEFWTKGFKELRLWIIQDAIIQLQVEVDNALTQLGLHGWKVELAIEKETKNGKLQRGFTVNIKSPDQESQQAVPWEAWSGGETQRIRIAGANGLQKLIQQRNGLDWGMEIWDEPTEHLSDRGIADLLEFLEAKAKTEKRQIWLITHTGLQAGNFDGLIEVVKGKNGSKIVEVA